MRGILRDYPRFAWENLEDRARVADSTLKHELAVLDVKAAISCALRKEPACELVEFPTWPVLFQFQASQPPKPGAQPRRVLIKPDGFLRLYHTEQGEVSEHFFFLEVDRSTEPRDTLALRALGYGDFYRRGGLALRYGYTAQDYGEFPFRALYVLPNEERRNNMAERLLQNTPPILTMVWLTTFEEVTTDPLGAIWMRPRDYRDITEGTAFDPRRPPERIYRRQPEREELVAEKLMKLRLFEE